MPGPRSESPAKAMVWVAMVVGGNGAIVMMEEVYDLRLRPRHHSSIAQQRGSGLAIQIQDVQDRVLVVRGHIVELDIHELGPLQTSQIGPQGLADVPGSIAPRRISQMLHRATTRQLNHHEPTHHQTPSTSPTPSTTPPCTIPIFTTQPYTFHAPSNTHPSMHPPPTDTHLLIPPYNTTIAPHQPPLCTHLPPPPNMTTIITTITHTTITLYTIHHP